MRKNISQPLLVLLNERSMPQNELAKMIGVDPSTVSRFASGQLWASEEQVEALSKALDVPREYFTQNETVAVSAHIENQQGGTVNQYSVHNGGSAEALAAKDETIKALNAVVAAKDEALAAKDALINAYRQQGEA